MPAQRLLPDGSTLLLCRVEDRRGLSHLCAARSVNGVDGWQIDREPTLLPNAERISRRSVGHRRSAHYLCAGTQEICGGLHVLFSRWSGSVFGADGGFSELRKIRRRHVAGRQGRRASAAKDQRILGIDSSAHDATRSSRLDFLLSRFAALGKSQTDAGSSPRRLVGCEQDWDVAAAD